MSLLKIININDPGTGFRFGGDDLDTVNRLLSGEDLGYLLKLENILYMGGAQKLRILRPNGTNWVSFNSEAETANRAILIPLLGADQRMVFEALNQPLTNKDINFANNTPTNFPGAAINNASVDGAKLIDNTVLDAKINGVAFAKITGQIAMSQITDNTITNAKLQQITDKNKLHSNILYTTDAQTQTNKEIDNKQNMIRRLSRYGRYCPSLETSGIGEGALTGLVTLGVDAGDWQSSTGGKYHAWNTRAVANDAAGVVKLDTFTCQRSSNPILRSAFVYTTGGNKRAFRGLGAKRLLSTDSDTEPLLSTESGFLFGYGSSDTQFQIFHNDGTGTCVKDTTGINLPGSNTEYILDIEVDSAGSSFKWTLYLAAQFGGLKGTQVGTGTITTRIPASGTPLYWQNLVITTTAAAVGNNIQYDEVFI